MTTRSDYEGPSTRACRTVGCHNSCSGRLQFCDSCRKTRTTAALASMDASAEMSQSQNTKTCATCLLDRDREEFILSVDKNRRGHICARYGPDCDDCRMTRDWSLGVATPDVSGQPPYEAARRLLAYEYRVLPSKWMMRRTPLSDLHYLTMCKLGGVRTEGIDLKIADARDIIRRHGPL